MNVLIKRCCIIIWNRTISTIKTINYRFWSRNGGKSINSRKIIKMNRFQFNLNWKCIKNFELNCLFKNKIWHQIEAVNSMYDNESPKVSWSGDIQVTAFGMALTWNHSLLLGLAFLYIQGTVHSLFIYTECYTFNYEDHSDPG